ncbi:hypothetical protein BQ8482_220075 [Mesorhizobium delmotii]|uniref:Uncharacterized protein n=1 Tax=Mesorhizobium delmotii TaxID=1631247 RepID=A0A2P9AL79_9HYPH|nr:hypothetical protein BQ8482_220075 [Mesorhizobium delmotii]
MKDLLQAGHRIRLAAGPMRIKYSPTIGPIACDRLSIQEFWSTLEEHLVAAAAQNVACEDLGPTRQGRWCPALA